MQGRGITIDKDQYSIVSSLDSKKSVDSRYLQQADLYDSTTKKDVETSRRVKHIVGDVIFRNVMFLKEKGNDFKRPNFIDDVVRDEKDGKQTSKVQCIKICVRLMREIYCKYNFMSS